MRFFLSSFCLIGLLNIPFTGAVCAADPIPEPEEDAAGPIEVEVTDEEAADEIPAESEPETTAEPEPEPAPAPAPEPLVPPPTVDPELRNLYLGDQGSKLGSPAGPRTIKPRAPEKRKKPEDAWKSEIEVGAAGYRGNSDSELFIARFRSGKKTEKDEIEFNARTSYGVSDGEKNRQNAEASGKYRYNLGERLYVAPEARYYYDKIADVDYQAIGLLSLGYDVIKTEWTHFSLEAGPATIHEKKGGIPKDFVAFRLAESLEQRINTHVVIWERVEVLPALDDTSVYLVVAEAGIESALSSWLRFRTAIQHRYDSNPAEGKEQADLFLTASIAAEF